jgi:hypothetical protein
MKKSAFFSVALMLSFIFSAVRVHAQAFAAGTNVISAGLGLGSSLANGYTYGSQGIGLSASYERGIWEAGPGVISLGAYIGYKTFTYSGVAGGYSYDYKWNYTIIGGRGAYHFTGLNVDNLDLYAGLMLSYDNLSFSSSGDIPGYNASYSSGVALTPFVGARYYFANNLGVYGELGYGVAILSIGLSYKF